MADTPDNPMPEDPAIDSLEDRIAAARAAEDQRLAKETSSVVGSGGAGGMQVVSTMVGYPLGGIVIGFGLDNLFNTLPWITIVLMFLAFIGGCLHAMRLVKNRAN